MVILMMEILSHQPSPDNPDRVSKGATDTTRCYCRNEARLPFIVACLVDGVFGVLVDGEEEGVEQRDSDDVRFIAYI